LAASTIPPLSVRPCGTRERERERELITEHYKQESENLKTELKEPQQKAQEAFASVERLTSASSLTR
jgi:hypothetical protein